MNVEPLRRPLRLAARVAAVVLAGVLSGACGGGSSADCESAAVAQAHAESAWAEALQAHNAAHAADDEHDTHDELTAWRVSTIIAEAEVRNACG